jgi:iron complex outermembrane receptor protein
VETDYATTSLANPGGPTFVRLEPNPGFTAEELVAYETGYRVRPLESVYLTVSGFYNRLDDILSTELTGRYLEGRPPEPTREILPVMFRNGLSGESHGAELTADVRPLTWLRTTMNYSYVKVAVTQDPGARDVSQQARYEGITPRHQLQVQAAIDLPHRLSLDWTARHISPLAAGPVPAYTTSTVRVGWLLSPRFELSVVGQDLNETRHLEWPGANQIQRSGYAKLTWRQK